MNLLAPAVRGSPHHRMAPPTLGQLRNPAQFRPWLLSIVVSLSSKRLRRERLLKWVGLDAVADAQLAVPERTELQHAWMSTWARSGRSWAEPEFATRPHRRLLERFTPTLRSLKL